MNKSVILKSLLVSIVGSVLLTSCTASRRTVGGGVQGGGNSLTCSTPLSGTLSPVGGSLSGFRLGQSIAWTATAQGCSGKFVLVNSSGTFPFSSTSPAFFQVTYNASSSARSESAEIRAVDDLGNILGSIQVSSGSFSVGSSISCTATAVGSPISAPVDASGMMLAPISMTFQIQNSESFSLTQVTEAGVMIPAARVSLPLPTSQSSFLSPQISIVSTGTRTYSFKVQSSSGATGSCDVVATVNPTTASSSITSFTATPSLVNIGQSLVLSLQATGATSGTIDGSSVNLDANGMHNRTVIVNRTGRFVSTAAVGTATRTVQVTSNPTCQMEVISPPSMVPGNFQARVNIQGKFLGAVISGDQAYSAGIMGNDNGVSGLLVPVYVLSSPAPLTLKVYGPDETIGTCNATAVLPVPPTPTVPPTVVLTVSQLSPIVKSTVQVNWSSSRAISCEIRRDGMLVRSDLAGNFFIEDIRNSTVIAASCTNSGGTTHAPTANINVVGGWFQADRAPCNDVCRFYELQNGRSPDGNYCASGEQRKPSALGRFSFLYGCWGPCGNPTPEINAASVGENCYHPTQPPRSDGYVQPEQRRDNDPTDRTVGCFCVPR
jgi:hypothetical protein